jgi:hypothetical protein
MQNIATRPFIIPCCVTASEQAHLASRFTEHFLAPYLPKGYEMFLNPVSSVLLLTLSIIGIWHLVPMLIRIIEALIRLIKGLYDMINRSIDALDRLLTNICLKGTSTLFQNISNKSALVSKWAGELMK